MQLLTRLNHCHIAIISFTASLVSAQQWKEESHCSFDIFLDSSRCLYRHFAFPAQAYARVWNTSTLDYYVQQKLGGKQLPKKLDQNDDPNQMGGDVLVDGHGQVIWIYRSQSPTDRPTLEQLQCLSFPTIHDPSHLNFNPQRSDD